jgi:hypothetical protein
MASSLPVFAVAAAALSFTPPASLRIATFSANWRHACVRATSTGAGDLFDGADAERNAALSALKLAFFSSSELDAQRPVAEEDAAKLGLLRDVPLARWGFNILPHHREPAAATPTESAALASKQRVRPRPDSSQPCTRV